MMHDVLCIPQNLKDHNGKPMQWLSPRNIFSWVTLKIYRLDHNDVDLARMSENCLFVNAGISQAEL